MYKKANYLGVWLDKLVKCVNVIDIKKVQLHSFVFGSGFQEVVSAAVYIRCT